MKYIIRFCAEKEKGSLSYLNTSSVRFWIVFQTDAKNFEGGGGKSKANEKPGCYKITYKPNPVY